MGIGDFGAGDDEVGSELLFVTQSAAGNRPVALQLDITSRVHLADPDDSTKLKTIHAIDARVVNALAIQLGAMPGSPTTGTDWKRIGSPYDPRANAIALDVVGTALADMIAAQDITLKSVQLEPHEFGGTFVAVEYVNNRLDPSSSVTKRIPLS